MTASKQGLDSMVLGFSIPLSGVLFRSTLRVGRTCGTIGPGLTQAAIWRTGSSVRMVSTEMGGGEDTVIATLEQKLTKALEPTKLVVAPTYGDPNGAHVSIYVVSSAFAGQNVVKRHRTVYGAIWEELQGPIHAVDQLVTKTPEESKKWSCIFT